MGPDPSRIKPGRDYPGLIPMPAYGNLISGRNLRTLVTYLKLISSMPYPRDERVQRGAHLADTLGCFACHGRRGISGSPNPGSFKGYIPPWNSEDFDHLVHSDEELRQWILDGIAERLRDNPIGRHLVERQVIPMPAYRGHIDAEELEALVAYVKWVRQSLNQSIQPERPSWVTPQRPEDDIEALGKALYHQTGCAACHGSRGSHGRHNSRAAQSVVPDLDSVAKRMGLFTAAEAGDFVRYLSAAFDSDPIYFSAFKSDNKAAIMAEYERVFDLILQGKLATPDSETNQEAAMNMPSWNFRLKAGRIDRLRDINAIIAYLVSLQEWDE